jgi:hypothetical protein
VVLAIAVAVGLWFGYGAVRRAVAIRAIDRHERQWERDGPDDYRYRIEVLCFCFGPKAFDVTVEHGRVVATDPVPRREQVTPPTIEELFATARDAVRDHASKVRVRYDGHDGHVTSLSIDERRGVADDEVVYRVRNLRATGGDH